MTGTEKAMKAVILATTLLTGAALAPLALAPLTFAPMAQAAESSGSDWPTYGHDAGGDRFSPLAQITPANVARLRPAWTFHMKPAEAPAPAAAGSSTDAAVAAQREAEGAGPFRGARFSGSEATPLMAGGLLYLSTPYRTVVALEPETGKTAWTYAVPGPGQPSLRGVEYWPGGGKDAPEILFGARDGRLIALDARTGVPVAGFGKGGTLDLKTPDVMGDTPAAAAGRMPPYGLTSPPLVWKDLVITGAAVQEFPAIGAYGDIRAWDVRTGKLAWTFHAVPRPGEFGHDTWEGDSWKNRSGVNNWGFMTADAARGIVYVAFGAPSWDRYGGDRHGVNLFSTAVVALDAKTGKRLWHFQVVHHDIWDFDTESPPTLMDVKRGGRVIPAVGVVSKSGYMFILDRVTGKPLYKVEEKPVPASTVPGEQTSPTQPFPEKPDPIARTTMSRADLADVTPELKAYCEGFVDKTHADLGGPYLPIEPGRVTVNFPGTLGGANWGGGTFDPRLGYYVVNTLDLAQVQFLVPDDKGPLPFKQGPGLGRFWQESSRMPCQKPPWGRLVAIDVNSGAIVWQSVLGVSDNLPEGLNKTGRPNIGGPISTAGGLVFVAATDDARFRAFDSKTGAEVWTVKLPASAHATPMTYRGKDGKQYVVIVSTGGSFLNSPLVSDAVTAFALP
jgi:quinoprotein glucose dehydrogenase